MKGNKEKFYPALDSLRWRSSGIEHLGRTGAAAAAVEVCQVQTERFGTA